MRRLTLATVLCAVLLLSGGELSIRTHYFPEPIDALSLGLATQGTSVAVQGRIDSGWTSWHTLATEADAAPGSRETELLVFGSAVERVRIESRSPYVLHPLTISDEPAHYTVAAVTPITKPRILSREQWGADEELLIGEEPASDPDAIGVGETGDVSRRVADCIQAQRTYPDEFKVARTMTTDTEGKELRWPQSYAQKVRLFIVHHTALTVAGDERVGVERMRALYQYHAGTLGWGDIGYHYVIDEKGVIYQGREGEDDRVVGGHAYCANVGTVGVALMGNFEIEKPTQAQWRSLKWLLSYLAQENSVNLNERVVFHGESLPAIVGHQDVGSTLCPGYYVDEVMAQLRSHILAGRLGSAIIPPERKEYQDRSVERRTERLARTTQTTEPLLEAVGETEYTTLPGGQVTFLVRYRAGDAAVPKRARLAEVERSSDRVGLWQELGGREVRVRRELLSPNTLKSGETQIIRIRALLPAQSNTYTVRIGNIVFTLRGEGRRLRSLTGDSSPSSAAENSAQPQRPSEVLEELTTPLNVHPERSIRIRLSSHQGDTATVTTGRYVTVNGRMYPETSVFLEREGESCTYRVGMLRLSSGVVRIEPQSGLFALTSLRATDNAFHGILECRVLNGELVLINEVSLEKYMEGLAEEPDTEPYEKQRAFSIAARSYAAYYMDPLHRKFPSLPYDGDDSPARFQAYRGASFAQRNPRWIAAVGSTTLQVITKDGQVVKTPYFSSDDGRTRSPEEVGWKHFPFAEVFQSKEDPWCKGFPMNGHGVGMSGCGAEAQAEEGRTGEEILRYYYPLTQIKTLP